MRPTRRSRQQAPESQSVAATHEPERPSTHLSKHVLYAVRWLRLLKTRRQQRFATTSAAAVLARCWHGRNLPAARTSSHSGEKCGLGHLVLSNGSWSGQPLMPDGFAAQIIRARSNGGDPVRLPYGLFWWVPSGSTYFASGYGGQLVWVHAPMNLVVAVTSEVSRESPRRGHALKLTRGPLFQAVRARISGAPRP